MTDKQIMIDGVDVSECEFCDWKGSDIPQCRIRQASFEPTCKGYNCYYKQLAREKQNSQEARDTAIKEFNRAEELKTLLKRKEQECEELKLQLTSLAYADAICALEIDLEHKTQECEELKKQLTDFMNGEYCVNGCAKMQTQYKEYHCKLIEQLDKLKTENERLQKSQFCFAYEKDCHKVCKQQNCIIKNGYKAEQKLERIRDICLHEVKELTDSAIHGGRYVEISQIIDEVE